MPFSLALVAPITVDNVRVTYDDPTNGVVSIRADRIGSNNTKCRVQTSVAITGTSTLPGSTKTFTSTSTFAYFLRPDAGSPWEVLPYFTLKLRVVNTVVFGAIDAGTNTQAVTITTDQYDANDVLVDSRSQSSTINLAQSQSLASTLGGLSLGDQIRYQWQA